MSDSMQGFRFEVAYAVGTRSMDTFLWYETANERRTAGEQKFLPTRRLPRFASARHHAGHLPAGQVGPRQGCANA